MLKRVCKCIPALKLVWVLWPAHCTQIHLVILPSPYTFVFVTKNKPLLANHALLETYFQDEDSQMDTQ